MGLVKPLVNFRAASYEPRALGEKAASCRLRAASHQRSVSDWLARSSQFVARSDAAEIAEAAMVLPLVFMFLLGCVWFGRAFNIYTTITQAAQQGAITAARASSISSGNTFPPDGPITKAGTVTYAVAAVMQASNLDPSQIMPLSSPPSGCTATSNIEICRNVQLNPSQSATQPVFCSNSEPPSNTQICGTFVSFQYPYQFHVPFTTLDSIVLTAQAQTRMEQ